MRSKQRSLAETKKKEKKSERASEGRELDRLFNSLSPRAPALRPFCNFVNCVPLRGAAAAMTPVREAVTRARAGATAAFIVVFSLKERGEEKKKKNLS